MPQRLPIRKSLRFFTMIEMIAVMAIAGILVSIAASLSINDSSKANALLLKSALQVGHVNSLSKLQKNPDDYIEVKVDPTLKTIEVIYHDTNNSTTTIISEKSLVNGSYAAYNDSGTWTPMTTSNSVYFNYKGEPLQTTSVTDIHTSELQFKFLRDNQDSNSPTLYLKPYTGKITFY